MVQLALNTVVAFEKSVQADQGNAFRGWLKQVLPHIGDAYRQDDAPFRSHLGASGVGKDCARAVWYSYRWATLRRNEGRMVRLFNRGHLEEGRMIALLLTIGCKVYQQDENGNQFRISAAGGHYGGSGDGVIVDSPDVPPGLPALGEFKTHNDKSFKELAGDNWKEIVEAAVAGRPLPAFKGKGVKNAKPEHYIQMQQYMRHMNLTAALYFAINKNDDSIYCELVQLDIETADQFTDRGIKIVYMRQPPKRISETPGWYGCRFCDHRQVCHYGEAPNRNCRTCEFAVPREDGKWWCENKDRQLTMLFGPKEGLNVEGETYELTKARQLTGCAMWIKNNGI